MRKPFYIKNRNLDSPGPPETATNASGGSGPASGRELRFVDKKTGLLLLNIQYEPVFLCQCHKNLTMSVLYKVSVNGEWSFEMDADALIPFDMAPLDATSVHVLNEHQSYKTSLLQADFLNKSYRISVNGKPFEVRIAAPLDQLISAMGFELGSTRNISQIEAPMPGLILDIQVSKGDSVREGDPLLVLEAMKMENVILSPREGVVKRVAVTKGMAVDKKHLLVEFE
jgi:biotin carboxyl carrier protein